MTLVAGQSASTYLFRYSLPHVHAAAAFQHGEEFALARAHGNPPAPGFAAPHAAIHTPGRQRVIDPVPGLAQGVAAHQAFRAGAVGVRFSRRVGREFDESCRVHAHIFELRRGTGGKGTRA